ncbi:hypothetical protein V6S67_07205 [Arthrobacter sp. Soc17.1.1.1]|uniref:hypothetical protein n=1 Tax=Arthrobacter sp. Soc17.1.1.1 TaxID=3121277 RepID=UPI002FE4A802
MNQKAGSAEPHTVRTEAVDLQLAIFYTVARAKGRSVHDARKVFSHAVSALHITPPSGLWVDAAMTSAALGRTYIISSEARDGAESILKDRDVSTLVSEGEDSGP